MDTNVIYIPNRLKNASKGGFVTGSGDIIDDSRNKSQEQVNNDIQQQLDNKYNKDEVYNRNETYSKAQLNNLITTPDQKYETVTATEETTAVTDVLPQVGSANTIYRVGNWDGEQYDDSVYSEYAWNGTEYQFLSKKQPGIDDVPTKYSNNLVKSGGIKELFDSQYEYSEEDFEISDEEGYSIVIFNQGHFKTKYFDSSKNFTYAEDDYNDFSIGNGDYDILGIYKGHIKTKNFDSSKAIIQKDASCDLEIGDIDNFSVFAVINGYPVTKNFNGRVIAKSFSTLENAAKIIEDNGMYETVVVNIADYDNNLLNVFEAISPSPQKHYTILIPEGTYNVDSWFSAEYIINSNQTQDRGVELPNYIKLLGIGNVNHIILQWINTDYPKLSYISTLNTHEWHEMENLTVIGKNIRYAVHDDVWNGQPRHLRVKNCIFIGDGSCSRAWGGGTNGGYDAEFVNCKFILPDTNICNDSYVEPIVIHDNYYNTTKDSHLLFRDCRFYNSHDTEKYIMPGTSSWQAIAYNAQYSQYIPNNKYVNGNCVNMPNNTDYSYKCIVAESRIPPYNIGRPCVNIGYGAQGATKTLYVTVEGCSANTYICVSSKLTFVMGFGNKFKDFTRFNTESSEDINNVVDII